MMVASNASRRTQSFRNPIVELCGKPQKMTLPDGKPKGLERLLKEHGFDV